MIDDLQDLLEEQNTTVYAIKRIIPNYKKLSKANITLIRTRARLSDLQKLWEKAHRLHSKISRVATTEEKKRLPYFVQDEFLAAEDDYNEASDYLQEAIGGCVAPESLAYDPDPAFPVGNEPRSSSLTFPRIPFPTFSGKISEWQKFRDTFHSMVHSNKTNVAKFYCLTSSVIGDAVAILDKFDDSSDNYNDAWEMLLNEYDDERALISTNLQSFICFPKGKFETAAELKKLRDTVNVALKNLSKLGCQVSS
jgi:hypothetical protein